MRRIELFRIGRVQGIIMKRVAVFGSIGIFGLICVQGASAGSLTVIDSFVPPTNGLSLCDFADETPGRMSGSGFTWGGFTHASVAGWRGQVNISAAHHRLELYANADSDTTISANYNSTYIYTIFDSNGSSLADQALALDGIEADVASAAPGQQVRWLVRDANYEWYLSAPTGVVAGTTYVLNPASVGWLRVDAFAETEMNALDADAKQAIADPSTLSVGTPDLSAVTGGGLYIESGDTEPAAQYNFILTEMRWTGEAAMVPVPPDVDAVPVMVDVTRRRSINGQLSVVRKNLFNVHAGAGSFSTAQKQYLFEDLDVNAGRGFGVLWKMKQIKEDLDRSGYWDEDQMNSQIASAYNNWVSAGSPGHDNTTDSITTSHTSTHYPSAADIAAAPPNGFRTRDHLANAEFVSKYIQMFYPRMSWYEFSNEINGEAGELGTTWADISTLCKTIADRVHADGLNVNFVGFGGKWPAFERNNFGIWDRDWVEFIDIAGASMDAYSVHLYSRMGPNAEAVMDMINNYSMISLGETRPLMITEFGHLPDMTGTLEEKFWENMRGQNSFFLQFLERGGLMGRSIPFNTASATTWASAMLVDSGGTMVWSDMLKLYELWKDFRGERIEVSTGDPDVLAHAVLDGTAVRIAVYNTSDMPVDIGLEYLTGDADIISADISRLYWGASSAEVILNGAFNPSKSLLTISGYEAVVLSLHLTDVPSEQRLNEKVSYFGDTMIQPIAAMNPMTVNINGLDETKNIVKARLRISSGNISGWIPAEVMVNGVPVEMPADQLGDASDDLRAYEAEVPYYLLTSSNVVSVTYSSGGGHFAGAVMDVTYGDPIALDSDGDGLSDEFEFRYGGAPESIDPLDEGTSGDGLSALAEFAMGLDPTMNNSGSRPTVSFTNLLGADYLAVTYRRSREALPYLDMYVLHATNLTEGIGWQSNQTQVVRTESLTGEVESVTERSLFSISESDEEFLNVEVRSK